MPRKSNIPFGDKRKSELARVNRNIENKQKNLQKRFGMKADFEKKSVSDFKSIKEFNAYIEQAKHFTKRAANKFDLVTPKGDKLNFNVLRKIEKEMKRINKIKDREFGKLKDLPHREMGRKTGLTIGENMDKRIGFTDPKFEHFKHFEMDYTHLHGTKDAMLRLNKLQTNYKNDFISERHQLFFENYLQSLKTVFNKSSHPLMYHLPQEVWEIHDKIMDMGVEGFMDLYYKGLIPSLEFMYGKDMEETKTDELTTAFDVNIE